MKPSFGLSLVLAASASAGQEDCTPKQVHIAGSNDASQAMTVTFLTRDKCDQASISFGMDIDSMDRVATSTDAPYTYSQETTKYGSYTSDYIHNIEMSGLSAGSRYYYSISGSDVHHSFTSAPTSATYPVKFAVVGDLGQTSDSASTVKHMSEENVDAILHAGDMSYSDCDHTRWDSWFDMVEFVASETPWYVVGGNHEIEHSDVSNEIFVAYEARFAMPKIKDAVMEPTTSGVATSCTPSEMYGAHYDYGNSFYSFEWGPATIVMLNSYTDTAESSPQYDWLVSELEQIDRKKTPWVIALYHCPSYNSFSDHQGEKQQIAMKENMEPLFAKYRVNVAFSGHVHAYERTFPVVDNEVNEFGPVYVVTGEGGNREGHASGYLNDTPPSWSAFRDLETFGHSTLEIVNSTHALFTWKKNVAPGLFETADAVTLHNQFFE